MGIFFALCLHRDTADTAIVEAIRGRAGNTQIALHGLLLQLKILFQCI